MDSRRSIYRCGGAACGRCNVGGDAAGKTAGRSRRACSHPFGGQGDLRNRLRAPGFWLRQLAELDRLGLRHGWALSGSEEHAFLVPSTTVRSETKPRTAAVSAA